MNCFVHMLPVTQNLIDQRHLTTDLKDAPMCGYTQLRNNLTVEPVTGCQGEHVAHSPYRNTLVEAGEFIWEKMEKASGRVICQKSEIR